jgi:pyrroloquinoline quinone biosynthesis protein B
MTLQVLVLGSAAGGGFPQWNCGCGNCVAVRQHRPGFRARTQDSLAVSADGDRWWLLNASPDILSQIQATPELWARELRHSPIAGIVLTNGDLDHVLGLLLLRESQRLSVYATPRVAEGLRQNVMLRTLQRFEDQVRWRTLELGAATQLLEAEGRPSGLEISAWAVPGKPPLHLMHSFAPSAEDNVALRVTHDGSDASSLVYATAVANLDDLTPFANTEALFFDGTFWSEDELPSLGVAVGSARSMAHLPISGDAGSLRRLASLPIEHRYYTHVNNTNPVLDETSPEHELVRRAGVRIAVDGLRLSLGRPCDR